MNDGYGSGLGNGSGLDSCGGRYPAGVQTAHVCTQLQSSASSTSDKYQCPTSRGAGVLAG